MELTAQNMTLQVLSMVVGLDAVRAGELSVGILEGDDGALRGTGTNSRSSRAPRGARQDAPASRAHKQCRLLVVRGLHQ